MKIIRILSKLIIGIIILFSLLVIISLLLKDEIGDCISDGGAWSYLSHKCAYKISDLPRAEQQKYIDICKENPQAHWEEETCTEIMSKLKK